MQLKVKLEGETEIFNLTERNNRHRCPNCNGSIAAQPLGPDGSPLGVYGLAPQLFREDEYREGVVAAPRAWFEPEFHQNYAQSPIQINSDAPKYRNFPAERWGQEDGAMDGAYTNAQLNNDQTEKTEKTEEQQ
jgi:hypothetical protein